jgi:hypothetical protein
MRDLGGDRGTQRLLMAETLGLAMARRAAEILDRHRAVLSGIATDEPGQHTAQFAEDNAIFAAVLDAANECLGRFDSRPANDRWCDALLQLLRLAEFTAEASSAVGEGRDTGVEVVGVVGPGNGERAV